MKINNIVLERIRQNIMKEELNEQIEDWKLSVPDGDINCFINHALNIIIDTLKYINQDNIEYIEKYNLQTEQKSQLLNKSLNDIKKNFNTTKNITTQQLDKLKEQALSLDESHQKQKLLTKINLTKDKIKQINDVQEK